MPKSARKDSKPDGTFHEALIDSLFDAVYAIDRSRNITYWNQAAASLTGFGREEVLGRACADGLLCHTDSGGRPLCGNGSCPASKVMVTGEPIEEEVHFRHAEGHRVPVRTRISPVRDEQGQIVGAVEVFVDDSSRRAERELVEQMRKQSLLDELTGIGNRRMALEAIKGRLGELDRYSSPFGLLFLDIDHFKAVNDLHGHAAGDEALKLVARTLRNSVRAFDTVARWGGEEVLVVLVNVDAASLRKKADALRRLIESSRLPLPHAEGLGVTVSIGATLARRGETADALVDRADALMYQSKRAGRNLVTSG